MKSKTFLIMISIFFLSLWGWTIKIYPNINWISFIIFVTGILIQISLLINFKKIKNIEEVLGVSLLFSIIGLLPAILSGKYENDYEVIRSLFFSLSLFLLSITILFEENIIPVLNEKTLLTINIITLYLIFKNNFPTILLITYITFSLFIIINSFINKHPKKWQERSMFAWYFILIITIPISHFNFSDLNNLIVLNHNFTIEKTLALGMSFCFVLINFVYLLSFIRLLPNNNGKTPSKAFREKNNIKIPETSDLFNRKYDEKLQMNIYETLIIIATLCSFLTLNYFYNFLSDNIIIIFIFVFASFIAKNKQTDCIKN